MKINLQKVGTTAKAGTLDVSDKTFGCEYNEALIHQVVTAYRAGGRAGTRAQKTRSDVRGGGAKPWKQKGTGRARAGTSRSPIWRSGGVTFAARPQNFEQKVNKKMQRRAMQSILSELVRQERLIAVESFTVKTPKTADLLKILKALKLDNVLIVSDSIDQNLYLAARNIPRIDVRDIAGTDPVSLIAFDRVLMTAPAIKQFEEMLG